MGHIRLPIGPSETILAQAISFDQSELCHFIAILCQTMAPKKAMKAMKALKAMKLGKFAMKAMKAIMKALKAKKKAKRDKQKQMLAAGYIFDGVCPDTGIHWWIHPDDLPFVDRGFMR